MEVNHWTVHHPLYPERKVVDDVSMYVRKGEVVGIYGLMGAGRTELAMSIFGQSYGVNFSGGPVGSSNQILVNRVLEVCGVKVDMSNLPNSDASRALGDGTIKGFALAHPAAAVSELEATNTLKILTIPDDKVDAFKAAYPQYVWLTIPGGYYKCLPEDTYNVGLYNMVIANVATDEELVYQVVKACYENQDLIKSIFAQFGNEMSIENIGYSTIPYHAGAVRYFKEIGADVPAELVPPEYKG